MTKAQLRRLSDTRSIERAFKAGWRPFRCPRCKAPMARDLTVADPVYQCTECATRWREAIPPVY